MTLVFTLIFLACAAAFVHLAYRWSRLEYRETSLIVVITIGFGCALVAAYLSYTERWGTP